MSRNVMLVQPAPRGGFITSTFVALYWVGIILPLMMVWYFCKFLVIGTLWLATQIGLFLAQRHAPRPVKTGGGRHRAGFHPVERLILGKDLSAAMRERERANV